MILYYINQYMWSLKPFRIIGQNELKEKYEEFLRVYVETNCKDSQRELYCYKTQNIELITHFIYSKINQEITHVNSIYKNNTYNSNNPKLDRFLNTFIMNNKSMISDNFIGFLIESTSCSNCQNRMMRYGNYYQAITDYKDIYYIAFDMEKNAASNFNPRMSFDGSFFNNQFNNFYQDVSLNIYNCFNMEFNKKIQSYCPLCNFNTQKFIQKRFYTPPKVLTIILNNNEKGNFFIHDEINLSKYSYYNGNQKYVLISILCKLSYDDKYSLYCFNYKDSNWYCYSKKETKFGKIMKRVDYLDPNAIPYILVYQDIENMACEYIPINLKMANKKQGYLFRFQNGLAQKRLYFDSYAKVIDAASEIAKIFKLKKVKILINGEIKKDNDLLYDVGANAPNILVIGS